MIADCQAGNILLSNLFPAILLIASCGKTRNSQSKESRNQNRTPAIHSNRKLSFLNKINSTSIIICTLEWTGPLSHRALALAVIRILGLGLGRTRGSPLDLAVIRSLGLGRARGP